MKSKILMLSILLAMAVGTALGQVINVKGVVVDENDEPVVGVTVRLKSDASKGANTDLQGRFTLQAQEGELLVVSYVGYQTQEVKAAATLRIKIQPDAELLDEVVVTAMGLTRAKKSIGYAAQEVKAEDLTRARVSDVNNALVGKVSGVRFVGGSGALFDAGKIYLRGSSSLGNTRGSEPIYVVDGVITNANAVNMDDVESVNVLKGPAATSLYGSRGGNGAIIITTKSIGEGKSEVSLSHTLTWELPYSHMDIQKEYGGGYLGASSDLLTFTYDPSKHPESYKAFDGRRYYDYSGDSSWGPKFDGKPYMPWYAWDPTDSRFGQQAPWQGEMNLTDLYRTGVNNTTNVAFAKAGKGYNTRISFTNVDRLGIRPNSDAQRRFLSIKSAFDVTKRLKVSLDYKYSIRSNHNVAPEGYSDFGQVEQSFTQWGNTNVNIKDLRQDYERKDGTFRTWNINWTPDNPEDFSAAYHSNPFALMNEVNERSTYQWNVFSGNVDYTLFEGLRIGFNVNGNLRTMLYEYKIPENLGETPFYRMQQNTLRDMLYQGYAMYSGRFVDNRLTLDAALFGESRDYDLYLLDGYTKGGMFQNKFWNLAASNEPAVGASQITRMKSRSVYGTATIGFDDTYYLDLNVRNDWSSTLHPDHNSYLYGGASASILLHKFFNAPWLNFLKLRGSFAQVGSTMDAYQVTQTMVTETKYNKLTTMRFGWNLRRPDIKPTISTSYEVGAEFRLFSNRLYGDVNFYNRDSRNQIINRNIVPASGYRTEKINAGLIRNRGIEVTLGGTPIQTKDFAWDLNFNISRNVNTLVELFANDKPDDTYELAWMGFGQRIYNIAREGSPLGIIRAKKWKTDEAGNRVLRKLRNGQVAPVLDSEISDLGTIQPDFTGGFSTSLSYKGFALSATMDFSVGGKLASTTNLWGNGSGILASTVGLNAQGKPIRDAVEQGGGIHFVGVDTKGEKLEGYLDAQTYYQGLYSNAWGEVVYDATYVKLREVSLSYSFSKALLAKTKIGLQAARISLVAQNPWLIYSAIPNIDASEAANAYGGYLETGQAMSTRSFGCTLSLTF